MAASRLEDKLLDDGDQRSTTFAILREVVVLAGPNILAQVFMIFGQTVNVMMVGKFGDPSALAALGLGNMLMNCTALSICIGLAGAMDTLVSQSFGADRHDLTCLALQRSRIINTLQLLWMLPVLYSAESLLLLTGQDPEVAKLTADYLFPSLPSLFLVFQYQIALKFLQNRQESNPGAIVSFATSVLHCVWCYLFIVHLQWGIVGAGYANAVTYSLQGLVMNAYLLYYVRKADLSVKSVMWFEDGCLREWGEYMKYGIPSTLMLCAEWWFWEICALIVGCMSKEALAAHVASFSYISVAFMPTIGLAAACTALVGSALGDNLPQKARRTMTICVQLNLVMWSAVAGCTVLGRRTVSAFYSDSSEVRHVVQILLTIFAFAGFFDSSQNIMGSALRAMGKQDLALWTYVVTYYLVMLPVGLFFAFKLELQVYGLWCSFAVGTSLACCFFASVMVRQDWEGLAEETSRRLEDEKTLGRSPSFARVRSPSFLVTQPCSGSPSATRVSVAAATSP